MFGGEVLTQMEATLPAASSVQPLMFGPADAQLYGCYHAPQITAASNAVGVLICPPIGYEMIRAHRCLRNLANRLAGAGSPVLRFDYLGCGDSAGELEDASIDAWVACIRLAAMELARLAQTDAVTIVGLRLGATLGALAMSRGLVEAQGATLWNPVVQGASQIEMMQSDHARHVARVKQEFGPVPDGASEELLGDRWPEQLLSEINTLDLLGVSSFPSSEVLVIDNGSSTSMEALAQHFRPLGCANLALEHVPEPGVWDVEPHLAAMPHQSIRRIVEWTSQQERTT
jgi:pimeloyl-ACP methyl ester carboxylesterase